MSDFILIYLFTVGFSFPLLLLVSFDRESNRPFYELLMVILMAFLPIINFIFAIGAVIALFKRLD